MLVSRSAGPIVLLAAVAAFVAFALCGVFCALPLLVLTGLLLFFFRDPPREVPPAPLGVVSPVDGRVRLVEALRDPYLGRDAYKISIRMHWWGPYVTRSPIEGKVCQQWYLPQGLNPRDLPHADMASIASDTHPRQARYAMRVRTDEDDEVVFVLRGALISQRLICLVQAGERIGQGQRCGLLRFAGTVDVYVPDNSRVNVAPGATVRAGSDIIATLVHKSGAESAETKEVLESL